MQRPTNHYSCLTAFPPCPLLPPHSLDVEKLKHGQFCAVGNAISTEIEPAPEFYMGELDHQQYDAKPGDDGSDLLFKHLCKRLDTYLRVTDITNQMKKTLHEGFQYR
jgi:peptide methionine sulfoxide reductase MsrA